MLYWPLFRYTDEEEGRVEVILEGSDRIDSTWKEYNFRFKPGDTSDQLPIACMYCSQRKIEKESIINDHFKSRARHCLAWNRTVF